VLQYGSYVEFHNNNMILNGTLESQGEHVNQSIWAYSGAPCDKWVEEGVTQGFHGQTAYLWYYAYNNTHGSLAGYHDFAAGYTVPDGTNHAYLLQFQSDNNTYSVFRDGVTIAANITGLGSGTCISAAGLEISNDGVHPLSNYEADTFDLVPLEWQDSNYATHVGWNTSSYWNDAPCGQGYTVPNCMNGVFYSSSHWADNKPN
jgi:hypothetical protein